MFLFNKLRNKCSGNIINVSQKFSCRFIIKNQLYSSLWQHYLILKTIHTLYFLFSHKWRIIFPYTLSIPYTNCSNCTDTQSGTWCMVLVNLIHTTSTWWGAPGFCFKLKKTAFLLSCCSSGWLHLEAGRATSRTRLPPTPLSLPFLPGPHNLKLAPRRMLLLDEEHCQWACRCGRLVEPNTSWDIITKELGQ